MKNTGKECEGWDSNPRTPTRLGPQPSAFDLAWLPSLLCHYKKVVYLIKSYVSAFFMKRIFSCSNKNEPDNFMIGELKKFFGHDGARTA